MNIETEQIARGILESLSDEKLVLSMTGTNYQIHLKPVPGAQISTPIGKRVKGTIHGHALRVFKAVEGGGGRFIEPLIGEPRIVAGLVQAIDKGGHRILVNVAVPMWLTLEKSQSLKDFAEGDLVNCYVQSGMQFTPA
jgi:hypothetical protein